MSDTQPGGRCPECGGSGKVSCAVTGFNPSGSARCLECGGSGTGRTPEASEAKGGEGKGRPILCNNLLSEAKRCARPSGHTEDHATDRDLKIERLEATIARLEGERDEARAELTEAWENGFAVGVGITLEVLREAYDRVCGTHYSIDAANRINDLIAELEAGKDGSNDG